MTDVSTLPKALGIKVAVPPRALGGRAAGATPWEQIIGAKEHPEVAGLEFIFESKGKAGSRAIAIKRRFYDVEPLSNIVAEIRRVPETVVAKLKGYDPALEWWGVWVTYKGELTERERAVLDAAAQSRREARKSAQEPPDDASAVAAAAAGS